MDSNTTSTDQPPQAESIGPIRHATLVTLLIGAGFIAFIGGVSYRENTGIHEVSFWRLKKAWKHNADVVIAGDSRSYIGLAPHAMEDSLPGLRIVNFGFNATGYSNPYMEAVEEVVDPKSTDPRVILCISPFTLTERAGHDYKVPTGGAHFMRRRKATPYEQFKYRNFNALYQFFTTIDPKDVTHGFAPHLRKNRKHLDWHANGWVGFRLIPEKQASQLIQYRRLMSNWKVQPKQTNTVLDFTRRMTAQGVKVYGVRPPTSKAMVDLENELSGFDEKRFVKRFEAAGGIWLEVDHAGYETFDDSHLNRESALRWSADLAQQINGIHPARSDRTRRPVEK